MRRSLLVLLLLAWATAFAQSGRKGTNPTPSSSPGPASSPSPEQLQLVNSSKPRLPQFVDGERIYTSKQVDERVHITKRPPGRYTEAARRLKISGLVVLRLILASDETVKHIEVVKGLPEGLVENSMAAARQIKFTPAKKDGKPVSVWVEVEYRFDIF
jgi:TonB family protein